MKTKTFPYVFALLIGITGCKNENLETTTVGVEETLIESDPLPSWKDGKTKESITSYVQDVTNSESKNFIPVVDRIATFDNDGNLWSEQPAYFQLFFAIDRIIAMAPDNPEWSHSYNSVYGKEL